MYVASVPNRGQYRSSHQHWLLIILKIVEWFEFKSFKKCTMLSVVTGQTSYACPTSIICMSLTSSYIYLTLEREANLNRSLTMIWPTENSRWTAGCRRWRAVQFAVIVFCFFIALYSQLRKFATKEEHYSHHWTFEALRADDGRQSISDVCSCANSLRVRLLHNCFISAYTWPFAAN